MKEIVIWGAGKIGRGFVAELFYGAGYGVSFVDENKDLVNLLKKNNEYKILKLFSESEREETVVSGFEAYHVSELQQIKNKFKSCGLVVLSIFPKAFEKAAKDLSQIIKEKSSEKEQNPIDILICSNVPNASGLLEKLLKKHLSEAENEYFNDKVGLISTIIIRVATDSGEEMKKNEPLAVVTNGYPYLYIEADKMKCGLPPVAGVVNIKNLEAESNRKLFTYNMLQAGYAYLGKSRGLEYLHDCANDPEIRKTVMGALEEASGALQVEYGFSKEEMDIWNRQAVKNTSNRMLNDKVDRLGSDPERKLKRNDRLVGAALLCRKSGILPYYLSKIIAYAFLFEETSGDFNEKIEKDMKLRGAKKAIRELCGLENEPDLVQLIFEHYEKAVGSDGILENDKRIGILKDAYAKGFMNEKKYKGCAQCLLLALFEVTGNLDKELFQAASGYSGGMALCSDGSCGGYSGGILFMGKYVGRRYDLLSGGDKEAQYKSYSMAQKLHDKFTETYGSVVCSEIQESVFGKSYCLRTKEVRNEFEKAGAHEDKCTGIVANGSMWTADILLEEGYID